MDEFWSWVEKVWLTCMTFDWPMVMFVIIRACVQFVMWASPWFTLCWTVCPECMAVQPEAPPHEGCIEMQPVIVRGASRTSPIANMVINRFWMDMVSRPQHFTPTFVKVTM